MTIKIPILAGLFPLLIAPLQMGVNSGQGHTVLEKPGALAAIPPRLRPSLETRMRQFIDAQVEGRWDDVARMLGRFRGGYRGERYTEAHKQCFLSRMRNSPMTSFVMTQTGASTEILNVPAGKRWYLLFGEAEFKKSSGTIKFSTVMTVYRYRGDWYFSPPTLDDAGCVAASRRPTLDADRGADAENLRLPLRVGSEDGPRTLQQLSLEVRFSPCLRHRREGP